MKNIISKDELLKKIRGKEEVIQDSSSSVVISGVYRMPKCKPIRRFRLLPETPKIKMEPEKYPDLEVKLTPGSFLVGANRLYHILEVNIESEIVKATLLGYDSNKCMYSFTLGNTHEFRLEEFTSEFWTNYYKWRTAHHEDFIQYSNPYNFIHPGTVIYDSSINGYFKFIDYVSPLKLASGKEHWILKAFLLYTEDNTLKRQYRDHLKSYYTEDTVMKRYPYIISYKNIRQVGEYEYRELVTGIKNLELKTNSIQKTPMNFLLKSLSDSGSFEVEGKTYYITRLDETEVKCIEITEDFSIIHHTFNLDNLPINHG